MLHLSMHLIRQSFMSSCAFTMPNPCTVALIYKLMSITSITAASVYPSLGFLGLCVCSKSCKQVLRDTTKKDPYTNLMHVCLNNCAYADFSGVFPCLWPCGRWAPPELQQQMCCRVPEGNSAL